MAEFQKVMKQAKRMCEAHICCHECPLNGIERANGGNKTLRCVAAVCDDEVERLEKIVMDWAAANLEPRYPSWHDAWKQLLPESKFTPCPVSHFGVNRPCDHNCAECKETQMTADIAEKLGIKPIGGTDDEDA